MCQDLGYFNLARGLTHQQADPDLHYERARDLRARVEGPEQTEQAVRGNFQVQTESKLFVRAPLVVPVALLAAMSHEGVKFLMDHQLWRWKLGRLLLKRLGSLSWTSLPVRRWPCSTTTRSRWRGEPLEGSTPHGRGGRLR